MKCGTFEIQRIVCAVAEFLRTAEPKTCATCHESIYELDIVASPETEGYACQRCGDLVCVICGCTETRACAGGCSWLGPGICSTHGPELNVVLARHGVPLNAAY